MKKQKLPEKIAAEFFHKIFEANILPMNMWDVDGTILDANDAYLDMIGYTRQDLQNKELSWKKLTDVEDSALDEKSIQAIRYKKLSPAYIKKYVKKDGSKISIRTFDAIANVVDSEGFSLFYPIKSSKE